VENNILPKGIRVAGDLYFTDNSGEKTHLGKGEVTIENNGLKKPLSDEQNQAIIDEVNKIWRPM
jgi:hypothetical protein